MKTAKTHSRTLNRMEIFLAASLAVFLLTGALSLGRQQALAEKVVRLHVLANSDSQEDQALKLQVRDAVVLRAAEILSAAENRGEAEADLTARLPELQQLAADTILANGYDYSVTASLEDTQFPTREYDSFTLPAGEYLALRVVIGEGAGKNWWCVVFPPLCAQTTTDLSAAAMAAGLSEEEVGLITEENEGYVLKFKSVELWTALQARLAG